MPDCPDFPSIVKAVDNSRVVTALLNSKGGTLALLAAWTLLWEFVLKPLGRWLKGRNA